MRGAANLCLRTLTPKLINIDSFVPLFRAGNINLEQISFAVVGPVDTENSTYMK